jgi:hypothetical protein
MSGFDDHSNRSSWRRLASLCGARGFWEAGLAGLYDADDPDLQALISAAAGTGNEWSGRLSPIMPPPPRRKRTSNGRQRPQTLLKMTPKQTSGYCFCADEMKVSADQLQKGRPDQATALTALAQRGSSGGRRDGENRRGGYEARALAPKQL